MRRATMKPRTKNDAKAWVEEAMNFYNASGKRIALAEFANPKGGFVNEEMYIFVLGSKGTMLAHGLNDKFIGEEFIHLKDADGKHFIKDIVSTANAKGSGWIEYKWFHPVTKEMVPKTVYFEKIDDLIICSGVYQNG
jgi:cytochrome c